jgi:hypothetical protein
VPAIVASLYFAALRANVVLSKENGTLELKPLVPFFQTERRTLPLKHGHVHQLVGTTHHSLNSPKQHATVPRDSNRTASSASTKRSKAPTPEMLLPDWAFLCAQNREAKSPNFRPLVGPKFRQPYVAKNPASEAKKRASFAKWLYYF